ncbi:MAG: hypothetical protein KJ749_02660, partial [Planctomycetes bacterium]|nr:hypothetical protein [Planctomycetota bacterium]
MAVPVKSSGPPPRHRKRILALALVLVVAAFAGVVEIVRRHYVDPENIRAKAESYLQQFSRGRVTVGGATFSWLEGITLTDVAVAEAPDEVSGSPGSVRRPDTVFSCPEVKLTHNLLAWGGDRLKITSLVALGPTCLIVRDVTHGSTNLAGLLRGDADAG